MTKHFYLNSQFFLSRRRDYFIETNPMTFFENFEMYSTLVNPEKPDFYDFTFG